VRVTRATPRPGEAGALPFPDPIAVTDPADPRLADYVALTDVQLRRRREPAEGLFVAEGEKVVRRAVAAGYPMRSLLVSPRWLPVMADVAAAAGAPVYVAEPALLEQVTGYHVHRGALASMQRTPLPATAELLGSARREGEPGQAADRTGSRGPGPLRRVLVLEDLVDHGNVGAIFRCAAALGIEAVILSPRCGDPLYRRSVKVSMGAVFAVPYARMDDWRRGLGEIRVAGFQLLALTPAQSAVPLTEVPFGDRVALLLGTEGDGLSSHWLHEADQAVCIPMSPSATAAGVDSLNVVAAAAIACHALVR
jgi:tRNA G18 (ribose-2'-O)-methylase SpoU